MITPSFQSSHLGSADASADSDEDIVGRSDIGVDGKIRAKEKEGMEEGEDSVRSEDEEEDMLAVAEDTAMSEDEEEHELAVGEDIAMSEGKVEERTEEGMLSVGEDTVMSEEDEEDEEDEEEEIGEDEVDREWHLKDSDNSSRTMKSTSDAYWMCNVGRDAEDVPSRFLVTHTRAGSHLRVSLIERSAANTFRRTAGPRTGTIDFNTHSQPRVDPSARFRKSLKLRYGTLLRAWRQLDASCAGRVGIDAFLQMARVGFDGNVKSVWETSFAKGREYCTLEDFDASAAQCLFQFKDKCVESCGSMAVAFGRYARHGEMKKAELETAISRVGCRVSSRRLLRALYSGNYADAVARYDARDFLWLEYQYVACHAGNAWRPPVVDLTTQLSPTQAFCALVRCSKPLRVEGFHGLSIRRKEQRQKREAPTVADPLGREAAEVTATELIDGYFALEQARLDPEQKNRICSDLLENISRLDELNDDYMAQLAEVYLVIFFLILCKPCATTR